MWEEGVIKLKDGGAEEDMEGRRECEEGGQKWGSRVEEVGRSGCWGGRGYVWHAWERKMVGALECEHTCSPGHTRPEADKSPSKSRSHHDINHQHPEQSQAEIKQVRLSTFLPQPRPHLIHPATLLLNPTFKSQFSRLPSSKPLLSSPLPSPPQSLQVLACLRMSLNAKIYPTPLLTPLPPHSSSLPA